MRSQRLLVHSAVLLLALACQENATSLVASGAFEATETIVSAEASGKILELRVEEGQSLSPGQTLGRIDCTLNTAMEQLDSQLKKCAITAPVGGTVLVKYAQPGELAAPGKALFKLADTRNMFLRAYVTGDQLSTLKLGQNLEVAADSGPEGSRLYQGRLAWISSRSEFTPKTIQTRNERANLVYAVKVAVENDGFLKIGMYGHLPEQGK